MHGRRPLPRTLTIPPRHGERRGAIPFPLARVRSRRGHLPPHKFLSARPIFRPRHDPPPRPVGAPVDLTGWHLTDRADDPTKWAFPQTALGPGGYLVVFASNKNRRTPGQPLHTDFALAADGEYLGLITPAAMTFLAPNPGPVFLPGGTADWTVNANWESNPAPYPDGPGAAAVVGPPGGETARNVELRAPVTRVPATLDTVEGPVDGRILGIRFDGEPLTYEAWRAVRFPDPDDFADPDISGLMASPAGDGIPNLLRFAFKLPARGAARTAMPRLERPGGGWTLSFPYDPGLRGLRWIVETTVDIADWTGAETIFDSSLDPLLPDPAGRLLLALPESPDTPRRFFRLRLIVTAH